VYSFLAVTQSLRYNFPRYVCHLDIFELFAVYVVLVISLRLKHHYHITPEDQKLRYEFLNLMIRHPLKINCKLQCMYTLFQAVLPKVCETIKDNVKNSAQSRESISIRFSAFPSPFCYPEYMNGIDRSLSFTYPTPVS